MDAEQEDIVDGPRTLLLQELDEDDEPSYEVDIVVDGRPVLGGWKCSACIIGTLILSNIAFFGITTNLVVYLVQEWGESNAAAANTVTNLSGTALLCSFFGAFLSDAYIGRSRASLTFSILSFLCMVLLSLSVLMISRDVANSAAARSFFTASLYLMAFASGPIVPVLTALGADQLSFVEQKEKYFQILTIAVAFSNLLPATLVTYIDNKGLWIWGSWTSTVAAGTGAALMAMAAPFCRQHATSGNPFIRIIQVLVAAWRNRKLRLQPKDSSALHDQSQGGCSSELHPNRVFSFLDKATLVNSSLDKEKQGCPTTQVEEFKSFLRVIPVGFAYLCIAMTITQVNTLFTEQAITMNIQVTTWFAIPPASIYVFYVIGAMVIGILGSVGGAGLFGQCFGICGRRAHKITSLRLLGVGLTCSIVSMVIAACVESHRLHLAQEGVLLSILWLVPQTILVGIASSFGYWGAVDFFYTEVSEGIRTIGSSLVVLFYGAGSFLISI